MGPLVLVGDRGFPCHRLSRVLGLGVVAENGFDLVLFCFVLFFFLFFFVVVVAVIIIILGPKGSKDFSPFHIKSKAHAEEEKVPKDE